MRNDNSNTSLRERMAEAAKAASNEALTKSLKCHLSEAQSKYDDGLIDFREFLETYGEASKMYAKLAQ